MRALTSATRSRTLYGQGGMAGRETVPHMYGVCGPSSSLASSTSLCSNSTHNLFMLIPDGYPARCFFGAPISTAHVLDRSALHSSTPSNGQSVNSDHAFLCSMLLKTVATAHRWRDSTTPHSQSVESSHRMETRLRIDCENKSGATMRNMHQRLAH